MEGIDKEGRGVNVNSNRSAIIKYFQSFYKTVLAMISKITIEVLFKKHIHTTICSKSKNTYL
jgi:hypothetical protein